MENQPLPVQQARVTARAEQAAAADAVTTVNTHGEVTSWNLAAPVRPGHL